MGDLCVDMVTLPSIDHGSNRGGSAVSLGENQNTSIGVHAFCIRHFLIRKIFKYLIAHEIVAFRGRKMTDKCPKNIVPIKNSNTVFIIPKSDVYKKDPRQR